MARGGAPVSDDESTGQDGRRRLVLLVVVVLLAVLGAGIGSVVLDDGGNSQPGVQTPPEINTTDVSLSVLESATLQNRSGVSPGASGTHRFVLRNEGPDAGTLSVVGLTLSEAENGIDGPESDVDGSPSNGELAEHFLVTLTMQSPDGETIPLYDTGEGPRPLSEVVEDAGRSQAVDVATEEEATLVLNWRLPQSTGNVVQSDSLRLRGTFQIRANTTAP